MAEESPQLLSLVLIAAILGLVPLFFVTATAFLKISVVMFLMRSAIGAQGTPPNMVLYAVALVLTLYTSAPVLGEIYILLTRPSLDYSSFSSWERASIEVREPIREHLMRFTEAREREFFVAATRKIWPEAAHDTVADDDLVILIPSFVVSELTRAFEIGFLLYLPFIVIDLVVSSILLSVGMFMISPMVISLPFKLFLFVFVDGWSRLIHGLVLSYG